MALLSKLTHPAPGSRKYKLALQILYITTFALAFDKLSGQNFVELVGALMLFYGAANVGEHFAQKGKVEDYE
jgi:hypothetical protein